MLIRVTTTKEKGMQFPLYSLIDYEFPIWLDGGPIRPEH
jgi:hypothetical protein